MMKKIFTLLFAVGTIGIASAQSCAHNDRRFDKTGPVFDRGYESSTFSLRERDAMIRKINFDFDRKVMAVRSSRWLRGNEKSRQIRLLEKERSQEIRLVQIRFEKSNRRSYDRRYDDNRGYRS